MGDKIVYVAFNRDLWMNEGGLFYGTELLTKNGFTRIA